MANDTAKSILLQVAFKEAAAVGAEDLEKVERLTGAYYNILVGSHDLLDIAIKDREFGNKGAARTSAAKTGAKPAAASNDEAPIVSIQGEDYFDYRGLKELGAKPERWPDFKKVGDKTNKGSEWLVDKDGVTPTAFAKLVDAEGV